VKFLDRTNNFDLVVSMKPPIELRMQLEQSIVVRNLSYVEIINSFLPLPFLKRVCQKNTMIRKLRRLLTFFLLSLMSALP
jgi:hypothetical protein